MKLVAAIFFGIVVGAVSIVSFKSSNQSIASISQNVKIVDTTERDCLAQNIYHEARGESLAGALAVGLVVKNRTKDHRYPDTYCGVIKQGPTRESWKGNGQTYPVRFKCQFTWYCDGKSDEVDTTSEEWNRSVMVANAVIGGRVYDFTDGATHYHTYEVNPKWGYMFKQVAQIDSHIFYRRP